MPVFSYDCPQCKIRVKRISKKEVLCEICEKPMKRVFTSIPGLRCTEKRDYLKNKNIVPNIEEITRKRSKDYFVENCIDEAIEKVAQNFGYQEAIAHAKRAGWLDKNTGKKITKIDLK